MNALPSPSDPRWSRANLQPTVEHIDDADELMDYFTASSTVSSGAPSRGSIIGLDALDGARDESNTPPSPEAPLCRRDLAYEVSRSLWGLIPPKNFGQVMPGVFRCSYPKPENFSFLKTLGFRSILTLVPEPYSDAHVSFITENGVQHFQIGIEPNKSPFITISPCNMSAALGVVMNPANYPLLIHCNKGKHRTGSVVGCLRKIMGWELEDIFDEYRHYANPKARVLDERYIELFDERAMLWLARSNNLIAQDEPVNDSPIPTRISTPHQITRLQS